MGYGDELMVAGRARVMQQTDPRKVRVTYQGVPKWSKWASVWENNPRIARPGEAGDFQNLPAMDMANNRPYHTFKTAQRWGYNLDFRPDVGELYFSDAELAFGAQHAGRIILEPNIKPGASPNKQWGWARWNTLAWLMQHAGLRPTQLGPPVTALLQGAEQVATQSFRMAAAVVSRARVAVLPDGGTHHGAAACGVRAVVIFGGFTPVELTGYPMHRNLGASLAEACGMRVPCPHCEKAMAAISPEQVFHELGEIL
jgi:ADP-heptose:LPS heptosyltransferase